MAVNSAGEPTPNHDVRTYFKSLINDQDSPTGEVQWEFVRDADQQVVHEKAKDQYDQMVWGFVYSPRAEDQPVHGYFVGPDGYPRPQIHSAAEFVEFEYSPRGDEVTRRFFDRYHRPQPGPYRVYGEQSRFDERGLPIELDSLNAEGRLMVDEAGSATFRVRYDALGNTLETWAFDADGVPTLLRKGWHRFVGQYDEHGNLIEETYFGVAGEPVLHIGGYHREIDRYDDRGNLIEKASSILMP